MAGHLFPVALDLRGKTCVVVGGGTVGERKAKALVEAETTVIVVAPEGTAELRALAAAGQLSFLAEPFAPKHLEGAFLVIAATDSPTVNDSIAEAAHERGVLVNLAAGTDDLESMDFGDFVTMATVRRGDLLLALTTGGAGPALTARLRRDLEDRFGPEWGPYVALLGELRATAKTQIPDRTERATALRRLASDEGIRTKLAAGETAAAWEEAIQCLSR